MHAVIFLDALKPGTEKTKKMRKGVGTPGGEEKKIKFPMGWVLPPRAYKGDAPSLWIWILASFIFASIVIMVYWNAFGSFKENFVSNEQKRLFDELSGKLESFCSMPNDSTFTFTKKVYGELVMTGYNNEFCIRGKNDLCKNITCQTNITSLFVPAGVESEYVFVIEKKDGVVRVKGSVG